ncbi:MAG: hypothetical protein ABR499_23450 [Gemmatimonadaceae bacterium]
MAESRKRVRTKLVATVALVATTATLNAAPAQAQAETATINERLRFNGQTVMIPATSPVRPGEAVALNGGLHVLLHLTVSSSGNCLVKGHANPQGLRLTVGGVTYRVVGAGNFTAHSQKEGDETRFHAVANFGLKSERGPGERAKVNFKGDVAPSCRTVHNLGIAAVEILREAQMSTP